MRAGILGSDLHVLNAFGIADRNTSKKTIRMEGRSICAQRLSARLIGSHATILVVAKLILVLNAFRHR